MLTQTGERVEPAGQESVSLLNGSPGSVRRETLVCLDSVCLEVHSIPEKLQKQPERLHKE